MATLEDRLLGEKTHYYCSSSEDEDDDDDTEGQKIITDSPGGPSYPSNDDWDGSSMNTGPKGVIKDWQRFKQLETEQRREHEKERIELAKKLAMSCRSHLDDEKENENEEDIDAVIDEEILRQYIMKRMQEMMENTTIKKQFGEVLVIGNGEEFLEAVDKEDKDVTVVVHVFESGVQGCEAMNGCLISLAKDYPDIKFCRLHASDAGLSRKFQGTGVPALLIYKAGQMMGNFVRLTDEFGDDFFASDVEAFLIEHGILLDRSLQPPGVKNLRGSCNKQGEDGDSD